MNTCRQKLSLLSINSLTQTDNLSEALLSEAIVVPLISMDKRI